MKSPFKLTSAGLCAAAAFLTACGSSGGQYVNSSERRTATLPPSAAGDSTRGDDAAQCKAFWRFPELVACRRANGTLESFSYPQIRWRVRYFVRYQAMPCGEMPTEQVAYVFHTVTNDLYSDRDLSDDQRLQIRNVLFTGRRHCK